MFSPECNAISFLGVSDRTNLKHCYSTYIVCSLTSSQDYTNLLYFSLAHLYLSLLPFFFLQLPTEPNNPFYLLSMPLISCTHMSVCTCAFWAETGFRSTWVYWYCENVFIFTLYSQHSNWFLVLAYAALTVTMLVIVDGCQEVAM